MIASNNRINKILFVTALLLFSIISNGQYTVFFAIWIFTAMLLFTIRKLPKWKGYIVAWFLISLGYFFGFDAGPLPIIIPISFALIFGLLTSLPYLIDSFFSKKRNFFLSTFIFPCSAVLIEYAYNRINPFGSWGNFAYTQQSQTILLQSISVFGMAYITFLITWFASVSNWLYEQRNDWENVKKGLFIYGFVLGITLLYGGYRVQFQRTNIKSVRVASISALDSLAVSFDIRGFNNPETEYQIRIEAKKQTTRLNQYLFDKSIAEAQAGAKIVFWAEGNGVILKEDENEIYEKANEIASEHNVYLGLGLAVLDPSNSKFLENKFVLFDYTGNKVIDYWKGISVPGGEAEISNNRATGIQKIETEYGTIAGVICFDLDFPNYLKGAGGSDILLAPSNDYKEIDPIHTDMAKFRAIEQGFNLIRQTSFGLSIGTDYTGEVISEMDHFTDNDKTLITQLPTKGVKTIYSIIGDTFIVFCLLLFISVIIMLKKWKSVTIN